MRKLALVTAAAVMSIGSISSASAAVVAPFSAPASSTAGVGMNRVALGLARPAQDDSRMSTTDSESFFHTGTGIVVTVLVIVAVGLGIYFAVDKNDTRPTSS